MTEKRGLAFYVGTANV